MRLFKLQIVVVAVAFLFGAIKGFSFIGGYYQSAFFLSLYAASISYVCAYVVTKVGTYQVIDSSDVRFNYALAALAIAAWATMLILHLHFSEACLNSSTPCEDLKLRDFAITGLVWVAVPMVYVARRFLRPAVEK